MCLTVRLMWEGSVAVFCNKFGETGPLKKRRRLLAGSAQRCQRLRSQLGACRAALSALVVAAPALIINGAQQLLEVAEPAWRHLQHGLLRPCRAAAQDIAASAHHVINKAKQLLQVAESAWHR